MTRSSPRKIGTAFESGVVRYLRTVGFPHAERRALRGNTDWGDITGTPGIVWECKGGAWAKTAGDGLIEQWLDETMREVANAGADVGLLVVQRAGIGPANAGRWWAIMPGHQYEILVDRERYGWQFGDRGPLRMHLSQACALLVYAGYGSALVEVADA